MCFQTSKNYTAKRAAIRQRNCEATKLTHVGGASTCSSSRVKTDVRNKSEKLRYLLRLLGNELGRAKGAASLSFDTESHTWVL